MTGKFKEVSRSGRLIGFELLCDNTLFFHGARDVSQEDLTELYPKFDFHALKQTHSCRLVPASEELLEADAHWTDQRKIALRISTADCLPVLVSHPAFICAIHAGWRGVHNGIIPESLNNLFKQFKAGDAVATIGPHIRAPSFEVDLELGREIAEQAARKFNCPNVLMPSPARPEKAHVDLTEIAKFQLRHSGVELDHIMDIRFDTKTDERFHSYRREQKGGTRNYSFIVRL